MAMNNSTELPWEAPGCCRRDCEPHRGELLCLVGTISAICGLTTICLVLPGLVAIPAGILVGIIARKDLESMNAGLMDPRGRELCERARIRSGIAVASSLLALLLLACLGLVPILTMFPGLHLLR
jgi:hypothetical protein